jgi:sterol 3beta-glucosyltransferase
MNSVVANALAVPGAIKDLIYPSNSISSSKSTQHKGNSSSSEDDDDNTSWLSGKSKSGIKLVYGLLGGNSGSAATHYYDTDEDSEEYDEDDEHTTRSDEAEALDERTITNFQKYFVLPSTEQLLVGKVVVYTLDSWLNSNNNVSLLVYRCSLMKTLPCYGKLYISSNYISFNSKGFATKAKMIVPFSDVLRIQKIRSRGYIFHSLSIVTQTKKEIFLEFSSISRRNSCFARLFIQHRKAFESKQSAPLNDWEAHLMQEELDEKEQAHVVPKNTGKKETHQSFTRF